MRQTTVLIAQLSSAAGVRAPLAHVADEVFLHLSRELEQQGLSRKVVADMFGLALRGYQRRVQRLTESSTDRGKTLWQATLAFIDSEGSTSRRRVFERFQHDDQAALAAVLKDLCSSGLVHRTGSGDQTIYGPTREEERIGLARESTLETTASLVWLELCRAPDSSSHHLAEHLSISPERVHEALDRLELEGRIERKGDQFTVASLHIPVGAQAGWELAVFDHYQTVCVALATKLRQGQARSAEGDTTGGQTVTFEIDENHPERDAVLGHLARVRQQTNDLWDRVEKHNRASPAEGRRRVGFYVGQVAFARDDEE